MYYAYSKSNTPWKLYHEAYPHIYHYISSRDKENQKQTKSLPSWSIHYIINLNFGQESFPLGAPSLSQSFIQKQVSDICGTTRAVIHISLYAAYSILMSFFPIFHHLFNLQSDCLAIGISSGFCHTSHSGDVSKRMYLHLDLDSAMCILLSLLI